ncbi:MAG: hypothetical protein LAO56_03405 [Acidobacteriia bacterium]|nr:hypothetical protein [Terriglobia bacterium]
MPDVPVVLLSGSTALPSTELIFVDAHFGFGTALDDLLWTMRTLTAAATAPPMAKSRAMTPAVDST